MLAAGCTNRHLVIAATALTLRIRLVAERGVPTIWKRLSVLWSVIRGDARLLWFALRHPLAPGWLKPAVALMVIYVLSPVDLIPT